MGRFSWSIVMRCVLGSLYMKEIGRSEMERRLSDCGSKDIACTWKTEGVILWKKAVLEVGEDQENDLPSEPLEGATLPFHSSALVQWNWFWSLKLHSYQTKCTGLSHHFSGNLSQQTPAIDTVVLWEWIANPWLWGFPEEDMWRIWRCLKQELTNEWSH